MQPETWKDETGEKGAKLNGIELFFSVGLAEIAEKYLKRV